MRGYGRKLLASLIAVLLAVFAPILASEPTGSKRFAAPAEEIIACRVLEGHTSPQLRLAVFVFHQQNQKERARLGTLLRQRSGSTVEVQTPDGGWHSATVLRLKSCFGRGLLLLPAGTAHLTEHAEFLLKFPTAQGSPTHQGQPVSPTAAVSLARERSYELFRAVPEFTPLTAKH